MSSTDRPQAFESQTGEPTVVPPERHGYSLLILIFLAILILLWLAPYVAQQVAYSISHGQEQARAQVALAELVKFPKEANPYPVVAKAIEPSVVGIETRTVVESSDQGFWDVQPQEEVSVTQGSGVIVDPAGYILTNAHVVSQATTGRVTVKLSDGRVLHNGQVVGTDPATDLAVVKIDAKGLTVARWGDSRRLEVGSRVLAVGSPYGLAETVTAGIISAKNRRVGIEKAGYRDFLQTDAAVNPGNSGGPLVNMQGELVGINTAIVGHAYQGISFAIPSDLAHKVYDLLRSTGISRGWIGVAILNVSQKAANKLGLKDTQGALIAKVIPDSPAAKAGIKPGDVIVTWDKQPIANATDLRIAVAKSKPGTTAAVVLDREGKEMDLKVTVAERPNQVTQ